MRVLWLLTITSIVILYCTVKTSAKDNSRLLRRTISSEKLARLKARVIAARRARYFRHRRPYPTGGRQLSHTSRNDSSRRTALSCPSNCVCLITNEVKCNMKSLKRVPNGIPDDVKRLNLGFNKISSVQRKHLTNFTATLLTLYLHHNEIRSLGNGNFVLKRLQLLRLSHNNIRDIRKASLYGLRDLQSLYLDQNRISSIHPLAFRGLTKLRMLQLEGNLLSRIDKDVFITMSFHTYFKFSSIRQLHLEDNNFKQLPRHVFDHVTKGASVYLRQNPWDCSCQSIWLKKWMDNSNISRCGSNGTDTQCPTCFSPEFAKDRRMSDVSVESMICSGYPVNDIESIEAENDLSIFQSTDYFSTRYSMHLNSENVSVLATKCSLAEPPSTTVSEDGNSGRSFSVSFEGIFACILTISPSDMPRDDVNALGDRSINLRSRSKREITAERNSESFSVEVDDVDYLGTTFSSATVSTESRFLLNNQSRIRFLNNKDFRQERTIRVEFRTSFKHKYDPKKTKFSKQPWLVIREPNPAKIDVKLLQSGEQLSIKCKVVGQPKPDVKWVLPAGEVINSGERNGRYSVQKSGKLTVKTAIPDDSGIYQCIASVKNSREPLKTAAVDIATVKIKVVEATKDDFTFSDLSPEMRQASVQRGSNWSSDCQFKTLINDATLVWITPDNQLLTGTSGDRHGRLSTYENGTMVISNFEKSDEGLYRCIGANVEGEEEIAVFVSILEDDVEDENIVPVEPDDYPDSDYPSDIVSDILPDVGNLGDEWDTIEEPSLVETNIPEIEFDVDDGDMNYDLDPSPSTTVASEMNSTNKISHTVTSQNLEKHAQDNSLAKRNESPMIDDADALDFDKMDVKTPNLDLMPAEEIEIDYDDYYEEDSIENANVTKTTASPIKRYESGMNVVTTTTDSPSMHNKTQTQEVKATQTQSHPTTTTPVTVSKSKYQNFLKTPQNAERSTPKVDATFRTHLNDEKISNPIKTTDATQEISSPKLTDNPTRHGDYDIIAEIEIASPTNNIITLPGNHDDIDFKPKNEYLGLKSEPDATVKPVTEQIIDPGPLFPVPVTEKDDIHSSDLGGKATNANLDSSSHDRNSTTSPTMEDTTTSSGLSNSEYEGKLTSRSEIEVIVPEIVGVDELVSNHSTPTPSHVTNIGRAIEFDALFPDVMYGEEEDFDIIPPRIKEPLGDETAHDSEKTDHGKLNVPVVASKEETSSEKPALNSFIKNDSSSIADIPGMNSSSKSASAKIPLLTAESLQNASLDTDQNTLSQSLEETAPLDIGQNGTSLTAFVEVSKDSSNKNAFDVVTSPKFDIAKTTTTNPVTTNDSLDSTTPSSDDGEGDFEVIDPALVTVSSSQDDVIDLDQSDDVYEILDMPAGKITRKPVIQRQNRNIIFGREHGKALLPCMPVDAPSRSWTFTWTLPSGDTYSRPDNIVSRDWTKYVHRNGSLLVTRLKPEDKGNYDCVTIDERNNVEYHTHVQLVVLERLRIHNPVKEYIQVETGSEVTIPCEATGSPEPSITWQTPWGAQLTYLRYLDDLQVLWNGTLRILNVKPGHRGLYKCYAKNPREIRMRTVTISMMVSPPTFLSPSNGMFPVRLGGTISLKCEVQGYPTPSIQWMLARGGTIRPNEAIFSGSRHLPKYRMMKDGSLTITRASNEDTGLYHCVISNYLGRSASRIELVVGSST